MNLQKRIEAFINLKYFLEKFLDDKSFFEDYKIIADNFKLILETEYFNNGWFTIDNIKYSLRAICECLTKEKIYKWLEKYNISNLNISPKRVGVVLAGNIPFVGFHDFMCVLITGNIFIGKMSSKDNRLMKSLSEILIKIEPDFENYIFFEEGFLKNTEAIIATGSNNSARYFEYYFKELPHIIRHNRNSVAILGGFETEQQIEKLADDIFLFFGLGCRNVSKIYIPKGFELKTIFEGIIKYSEIINVNKYANNYTYNRAIYLMDLKKFFDNNFALLYESEKIASPVSVTFYEYYSDLNKLKEYLKLNLTNIQCIATEIEISDLETVKLGETQQPELWDYADNVDTIEFLMQL